MTEVINPSAEQVSSWSMPFAILREISQKENKQKDRKRITISPSRIWQIRAGIFFSLKSKIKLAIFSNWIMLHWESTQNHQTKIK